VPTVNFQRVLLHEDGLVKKDEAEDLLIHRKNNRNKQEVDRKRKHKSIREKSAIELHLLDKSHGHVNKHSES